MCWEDERGNSASEKLKNKLEPCDDLLSAIDRTGPVAFSPQYGPNLIAVIIFFFFFFSSPLLFPFPHQNIVNQR